MLTAIIILGTACALLTLLVHFTDNKNTQLSVDNSLMKNRMESLQEKFDAMRATAPDDPLTVEGIKEAVRYNGFFPREASEGVLFKDDGFVYDIETSRLPVVFINHYNQFDAEGFDIDIFKEAARQVSDDLIMVKVEVEFKMKECNVRFFIAALDANNASFRDNLPRYIDILCDAKRKLIDIYMEKKEKQREEADEEPSATPDPADRFREHKKIFS